MTSPETPDPQSRPAVPQYGEYAAPGDPRFTPPVAVPAAATPTAPPSNRRRDAVASAVLLVIGFLSTVYTVLSALGLEEALRQLFVLYGGTGDYEPAAGVDVASGVIVASHVILYAVTLLITRSRVKAGRVAFWVPLVGGAVAAIIFFVTIAVVIISDSALLAAATEFATR